MIQIDMEMPTCCEHCFGRTDYFCEDRDIHYYDCYFADWENRELGSAYRGEEEEWHKDRPKWCPLKEIKERLCNKCAMRDRTKMCHIWGKDVKDDDYCSYWKERSR